MTEEKYCYQMLADLRQRYERDAKPFLDRLAVLKSLQPVPSTTLTLDQAREFIEFSMSSKSGAL